jgi:hypothetical protein
MIRKGRFCRSVLENINMLAKPAPTEVMNYAIAKRGLYGLAYSFRAALGG